MFGSDIIYTFGHNLILNVIISDMYVIINEVTLAYVCTRRDYHVCLIYDFFFVWKLVDQVNMNLLTMLI